jgi:hydrogenase expression/formation protein HypE
MSCEGVAIMAVDSTKTDGILKALRKHNATKDAQVIGHVQDGKPRVIMTTSIGGTKVVQVPYGEPVPRVC